MTEKKKKKAKASIVKKTKSESIQKMTGIDGLIQTALQEKSGVEVMEKLLKMKYDHEDRQAKKIFHENFCKMQAELPVIRQTKSVETKSGKLAYKYAPLRQIIKQIAPYLEKYGFSFHWTEENIEANGKRIVCHIVGHGHEEKASIDLPIMSASSMTNQIQQYGSTITYGKRYSLIGILGVMADADVDGQQNELKKPAPKVETPSKFTPAQQKEIDKIKVALGILGMTATGLMKGIQKDRPEIKRFDELSLKDLQAINENLSVRVDEQAAKNE